MSRGTEVRIVEDIVENDEVVIKKDSVLKVVGTAYEDFIRNKDKGMPEPIVYDNSGNVFKNPDYKPQRIDFKEFANRW